MSLKQKLINVDYENFIIIKNKLMKNTTLPANVWSDALKYLPSNHFIKWLINDAFDGFPLDNDVLVYASHLPIDLFIKFYNSTKCPHNLSSRAYINAILNNCEIERLDQLYELGFCIIDNDTKLLFEYACKLSDKVNYIKWVCDHIKCSMSLYSKP